MNVPSEDLREVARKRLEERRGFIPHLIVYLLVNAGLILVWATVAGRGFFWPGFVLLFWGIGLVMHAWNAFFSHPVTEAEIEREVEQLRSRTGSAQST
jgi:hypothetical protein